MDVITEASPDSSEFVGTLGRQNALLHQGYSLSFTITVVLNLISFEDEAPDTLSNGLRYHNGAQEIPVPVQVDTLGRRGCEMMIRDYALVYDLKISLDPVLKGLFEAVPHPSLEVFTSKIFFRLSHQFTESG